MQIQRIQTLWLVLALGCMIAFLVLPFGHIEGLIINGLPYETDLVSYDFMGLIVPLAIAMILTVIDIFAYSNLGQQIKFTILTLMMELVTAGIAVYVLCDKSTSGVITWNWSMAFIAGALIFTALALLGMRKDRKLLDSYNRLR